MTSNIGTVIARANFENKNHFHFVLGRKVYLPMGDTLTHGTRTGDLESDFYHLVESLQTNHTVVRGCRFVLNDDVLMLVNENRKILVCAQMRLIPVILLFDGQTIELHTYTLKLRGLEITWAYVAHNLIEVYACDDTTNLWKRDVVSFEIQNLSLTVL